jgi:hypothetical protein
MMPRFALFSLFLCSAAVVLGQSAPSFTGNTQGAAKPFAFNNPFAVNGSLGITAAPSVSAADRGKGALCRDSAGKTQADLSHLFQAPCMNVDAQTILAWNTPQPSLAPFAPHFGGRAEPLPTQWPKLKVEKIPTQWPDLKMQNISAGRSAAGTERR